MIDDPQPDDDPRVAEMLAAAPEVLRDSVRAFAQSVVSQGQVARNERPEADAEEHLRIIGGGLVPPGMFLHCVCIGVPDWDCTGVVIAPRVVLTAAHCEENITRIMVGGTQVLPNLSPDARIVQVRDVVIHPDYDKAQDANDITILILDAPAHIPPVRIASPAEIGAATAFELVGFGHENPDQQDSFGKKRQVKIDLPAIMERAPGEDLGSLPAQLGFHPEYEFVAGRKMLGKDSCSGDSGGPAYIRVGQALKLAGLTSRATLTAIADCGDGGIYVRPDHFRGWIDATIAEAGLAPLPY